MNPRLLVLVAGLVAAGLCPAADWPQWRGLRRDAVSPDTGLLKTFPPRGPKLAWTFKDAGVGYSSVAVAGGVVYGFGSTGHVTGEYVFALDATTGKQKWRTPIKNIQKLSDFTDNWGGGPRGAPTVDGDRLYAIGSQGDVVCLDTKGGKLVWQKNMTKDLNGELMSGWGYAESPLVDGERVICSPGGDDGTLAALDKKTGKVLWRSTGLSAKATYSSVIVADVGGLRHYVQLTKDGPAGFAPADGKLLWHETVTTYNTAAIPTPVFHDNCVYVTAGYDAGSGLVKLTSDGAGGLKSDVVYTESSIENQHGGVVLIGGHIYGHDDGKGLACQEFKTGKVAWTAGSDRKMEKCSVVAADGHLYCYGQDSGTLVCVEATPRKYTEKGRFTIPQKSTKRKPDGRIWTHPVIADGKLYLRDQELLFCFDLRAS
jgi:outer membrane protein assembly factor BamB